MRAMLHGIDIYGNACDLDPDGYVHFLQDPENSKNKSR